MALLLLGLGYYCFTAWVCFICKKKEGKKTWWSPYSWVIHGVGIFNIFIALVYCSMLDNNWRNTITQYARVTDEHYTLGRCFFITELTHTETQIHSHLWSILSHYCSSLDRHIFGLCEGPEAPGGNPQRYSVLLWGDCADHWDACCSAKSSNIYYC